MKNLILLLSLVGAPVAMASTLTCDFPDSVKLEATLSPTGHMAKASLDGAAVAQGDFSPVTVPPGGATIQIGGSETYPAGNKNYELTDPRNADVVYTLSLPLNTGNLSAIVVKLTMAQPNMSVQINNVICQNQ